MRAGGSGSLMDYIEITSNASITPVYFDVASLASKVGEVSPCQRNDIASASGHEVGDKLFSCPEVHDPGFAAGAESECIRLTVEDGGPNDVDGIKDGVVKLLIGEVPDIPDAVTPGISADNAGAVKSASRAVSPLRIVQGEAGRWMSMMCRCLRWRHVEDAGSEIERLRSLQRNNHDRDYATEKKRRPEGRRMNCLR